MPHLHIMKKSSHFLIDAYMRHNPLYISYFPGRRPGKNYQDEMS